MLAQAAAMKKTAAQFEDVNGSLQSMLSSLMNELSVLQSAWRGQGGRSFDQVKQAWERDQRTMSKALAETATAIRTSGAQYTVSDTQAAERVSKAGITLPL